MKWTFFISRISLLFDIHIICVLRYGLFKEKDKDWQEEIIDKEYIKGLLSLLSSILPTVRKIIQLLVFGIYQGTKRRTHTDMSLIKKQNKYLTNYQYF